MMQSARIEGDTSTGAHVHGGTIASRGKDARRICPIQAAHAPRHARGDTPAGGNKGVAADARGRPREHPQEQKGVILWAHAMAILR